MRSEPISIRHRIYGKIRPKLYRLGVLTLVRKLFSKGLRTKVATRIGLAGFDASAIGATTMNQNIMKRGIRHNRKIALQVDGINFVGDLRVDIGLGESSRLLVNAACHAHIPVAYSEVALPFENRGHDVIENLAQGSPYSFTIVHLNVPELPHAFETIPHKTFEGKYVIAFWYWELPEFPSEWCWAFDYLDEIWVASRYTQDTIARVSPVPVVRIPLPITVHPTKCTRRDFGIPENEFCFIFSFSPSSSVGRKNPFGVIEAFSRAFANADNPPFLIIKTHHLDSVYGRKLATPLQDAMRDIPGMLITDNLSRQEMTNLLSLSDCYISLHRSEGFGLGMAEAMALGKPVIATAYSGNMDFMSLVNSYGVRYNLCEIKQEDHIYFPEMKRVYQSGGMWADPDLGHAGELMTHVYQNREQAQQRGRQAQYDIITTFNQQNTGQMMLSRLQTIVKHNKASR
jgi:glycosyltransferase involved in cell wall biosynthesis